MRTRLGSLVVVVAGCGPAVPMDVTDTGGQTSAATSSTSGVSTTDVVTSTASTAPTSTGGEAGESTSTGSEAGVSSSTRGETGEVSVTMATTDTTTGTTTDTTTGTTTGESSTGEASGAVYRADFYYGQINRLTVYRADFDADNCAIIKFTETDSDPDVPVTLPPFWRVDWTQVSQGTTGCFEGDLGPDWEQTDSVIGMADFDISQACTIDIDLMATFPQDKPWVPMQIHFLAAELLIEGNC